jgi:hypothetical protein
MTPALVPVFSNQANLGITTFIGRVYAIKPIFY